MAISHFYTEGGGARVRFIISFNNPEQLRDNGNLKKNYFRSSSGRHGKHVTKFVVTFSSWMQLPHSFSPLDWKYSHLNNLKIGALFESQR